MVAQVLHMREKLDTHPRHNWGQHEHAHDSSVRHVTTDEVANYLQISFVSVYEITHNRLGYHTVCARQGPKIIHTVA